MELIAALLFGYLLGSIPFGLIITKMAGAGDVREIGSGNIGATNVLRTGNKKLAALTLIGDALKGTVAVVIARYFSTCRSGRCSWSISRAPVSCLAEIQGWQRRCHHTWGSHRGELAGDRVDGGSLACFCVIHSKSVSWLNHCHACGPHGALAVRGGFNIDSHLCSAGRIEFGSPSRE